MTKKKAGLGVAVIVAVVVLWSVFKPAPAEAVEITPYGSLNYMISNNENASGVSTSKAENNGSSIGVKLSDELSEGIEGFATLEVGIDADELTLVLTWVTLVYYQLEDKTLCSRVLLHHIQMYFQNMVTKRLKNFLAEIHTQLFTRILWEH